MSASIFGRDYSVPAGAPVSAENLGPARSEAPPLPVGDGSTAEELRLCSFLLELRPSTRFSVPGIFTICAPPTLGLRLFMIVTSIVAIIRKSRKYFMNSLK
jgi:hypothetical protein